MAEKSHNFTYDVFLSFRREDLPDTFIGYFREELKQKGIRAFPIDDDDVLNTSPADLISKAIEESKVLIAVLSENYASSTRSLDELVKIYSRRKGIQQHVFPVF